MMDAIKFIEERNRMCKSFDVSCEECPACDDTLHCLIGQKSTLDILEQIDIVEKWSAAHPLKTRQSVFLEQYPEAELTKDGAISICPIAVSSAYRTKTGGCASPARPQCAFCRREFWMQEIEENK